MYVYPLTIGPGFSIGTLINITIPITSRCTAHVNTRVKIEIWEGRYLIGPVDIVATYSLEATIAPGQTHNFVFPHTVQVGPNWGEGQYRRDLNAYLDYWDGSAWVNWGMYGWEDAYHVEAFIFEIGAPIIEAA